MTVISEFVLTDRWKRKVRALASQSGMPYEEALQEARIIEWQMGQKIQDLEHRENYFLKCLKNKIRAYGKTWWETKRVTNSVPSLDIIDSLIQVRGFDELFYEYLINDIKRILAEIDVIVMEMFVMRIQTKKQWNEIHKEFPQLKWRRFYSYVGEIKQVTREQICKFANE